MIGRVIEGDLEKASDCQTGRVYALSALLDGVGDRLDQSLNRSTLFLALYILDEPHIRFATRCFVFDDCPYRFPDDQQIHPSSMNLANAQVENQLLDFAVGEKKTVRIFLSQRVTSFPST